MQLTRYTGVREEAARWYARLNAHDCTESDRAAFNCWRQDRAHREAYAQIESFSNRVDAAASDPRLQALADEAFEAARHEIARPTDRWRVPAALAASLAVASLTALYMGVVSDGAHRAVAYETSAERTEITLADGTVVQLDVNTRISAAIGEERRAIRLLAGRAMFDVAHDAGRPFSVEALGSRTTALGTRFQVQQNSDEVLVTLEEGSVAIESTKSNSLYERLMPGEQLSFSPRTAAHHKRNVDLHAATGWTRGRLVFRQTPLADAVEEINRYARTKVRVGDPSIAELPVGGNFVIGESDMIVTALVAALPLRAVHASEREIILFRRYGTDAALESP